MIQVKDIQVSSIGLINTISVAEVVDEDVIFLALL
jgi:hypothetical protein